MITFKRGDTLTVVGCELQDENGLPVPLSDIVIRCHARTSTGALAIDFIVQKLGDQFNLLAGNTEDCPIGVLTADIEYEENGVVNSTQDFKIKCLRDWTYDH